MGSIAENVQSYRADLPPDVRILAAAKTRTAAEAKEALDAGVNYLGYNYVQEAQTVSTELERLFGADYAGRRDLLHLIGHLQTNKINKALPLFSMIQTIDSAEKARAVSARASVPVDILFQVNIGSEASKSGMAADQMLPSAAAIRDLSHVTLRGLMVIEPYEDDPEESRTYFKAMKELFNRLQDQEGDRISILSMGMSHNCRVAAEEGATLVRIGTGIFGERRKKAEG